MELLNMEKLEKIIPKGKKGKVILLAAGVGVAALALFLGRSRHDTQSLSYTPTASGGYPEAASEGVSNSFVQSDSIFDAIEDIYAKQEKQNQQQIDYMDKIFAKVERSQDRVADMEDGMTSIMAARDDKNNDLSRMAANSDAWFSAGTERRVELEQENAALASKYGLRKNQSNGSWLDGNGAVAYVTTKQTSSISTSNVSNTHDSGRGSSSGSGSGSSSGGGNAVEKQMAANSAAWHKAGSTAEKDRLHQANVKLSSQGTKSYDSIKGVWK